jgi:hypothetical protein
MACRGIALPFTLALPTLLYGSEIWTIKARDTRITAAEMKHTRPTARYTWTDHKMKSTEIAKELNITPVLNKIQDYKRK